LKERGYEREPGEAERQRERAGERGSEREREKERERERERESVSEMEAESQLILFPMMQQDDCHLYCLLWPLHPLVCSRAVIHTSTQFITVIKSHVCTGGAASV